MTLVILIGWHSQNFPQLAVLVCTILHGKPAPFHIQRNIKYNYINTIRPSLTASQKPGRVNGEKVFSLKPPLTDALSNNFELVRMVTGPHDTSQGRKVPSCFRTSTRSAQITGSWDSQCHLIVLKQNKPTERHI